jgi:hypothetical protein
VKIENARIARDGHFSLFRTSCIRLSVTTCATVQGEIECSLENTVQTRTTGKSSFTEVTNELPSLLVDYCMQYDMDGSCLTESLTRVALFAGDTEDWFWNYDTNGLRLAQLRFYMTV